MTEILYLTYSIVFFIALGISAIILDFYYDEKLRQDELKKTEKKKDIHHNQLV